MLFYLEEIHQSYVQVKTIRPAFEFRVEIRQNFAVVVFIQPKVVFRCDVQFETVVKRRHESYCNNSRYRVGRIEIAISLYHFIACIDVVSAARLWHDAEKVRRLHAPYGARFARWCIRNLCTYCPCCRPDRSSPAGPKRNGCGSSLRQEKKKWDG